MHSVEGRVSHMGHPALESGAFQKAIRPQRAIGGIFTQGDEAAHVAILEMPQRRTALDMGSETLRQEQRLLSRHLSGRGKRSAIRTREIRAISQCEDLLVAFRL